MPGKAVNENEVLSWLTLATALALLGVTLAAVIYFFSWFRRAYANLQRAGCRTEHSNGWAIGAWFVPILNLFRPYSIMREIWDDTHRLAYGTEPPRPLLGWWWASFLVMSIMSRVSNSLSDQDKTAQQLENAAIGDAIHSLFVVVFILLTIAIIKRVAVAEEQLLLRQQVNSIGELAPEPVDLGATEEEHYY
ncbi:DUF4328 domain-containing protein [Hymenobacter sp. GOD-10R]|uniref:DUF4328 domain-containing protein n=1 Tax=Hymenobacter sp. GOD-10R TaxID=3093922 RepID=UPI002D7925D4|nr:DUF4328 domain-containing protein [Hymenobacter sp. GOD-10R]WRQ26640.1 DUF4328 domain-containing protein [Hymenobacter sp. GOD-10R]